MRVPVQMRAASPAPFAEVPRQRAVTRRFAAIMAHDDFNDSVYPSFQELGLDETACAHTKDYLEQFTVARWAFVPSVLDPRPPRVAAFLATLPIVTVADFLACFSGPGAEAFKTAVGTWRRWLAIPPSAPPLFEVSPTPSAASSGVLAPRGSASHLAAAAGALVSPAAAAGAAAPPRASAAHPAHPATLLAAVPPVFPHAMSAQRPPPTSIFAPQPPPPPARPAVGAPPVPSTALAVASPSTIACIASPSRAGSRSFASAALAASPGVGAGLAAAAGASAAAQHLAAAQPEVMKQVQQVVEAGGRAIMHDVQQEVRRGGEAIVSEAKARAAEALARSHDELRAAAAADSAASAAAATSALRAEIDGVVPQAIADAEARTLARVGAEVPAMLQRHSADVRAAAAADTAQAVADAEARTLTRVDAEVPRVIAEHGDAVEARAAAHTAAAVATASADLRVVAKAEASAARDQAVATARAEVSAAREHAVTLARAEAQALAAQSADSTLQRALEAIREAAGDARSHVDTAIATRIADLTRVAREEARAAAEEAAEASPAHRRMRDAVDEALAAALPDLASRIGPLIVPPTNRRVVIRDARESLARQPSVSVASDHAAAGDVLRQAAHVPLPESHASVSRSRSRGALRGGGHVNLRAPGSSRGPIPVTTGRGVTSGSRGASVSQRTTAASTSRAPAASAFRPVRASAPVPVVYPPAEAVGLDRPLRASRPRVTREPPGHDIPSSSTSSSSSGSPSQGATSTEAFVTDGCTQSDSEGRRRRRRLHRDRPGDDDDVAKACDRAAERLANARVQEMQRRLDEQRRETERMRREHERELAEAKAQRDADREASRARRREAAARAARQRPAAADSAVVDLTSSPPPAVTRAPAAAATQAPASAAQAPASVAAPVGPPAGLGAGRSGRLPTRSRSRGQLRGGGAGGAAGAAAARRTDGGAVPSSSSSSSSGDTSSTDPIPELGLGGLPQWQMQAFGAPPGAAAAHPGSVFVPSAAQRAMGVAGHGGAAVPPAPAVAPPAATGAVSLPFAASAADMAVAMAGQPLPAHMHPGAIASSSTNPFSIAATQTELPITVFLYGPKAWADAGWFATLADQRHFVTVWRKQVMGAPAAGSSGKAKRHGNTAYALSAAERHEAESIIPLMPSAAADPLSPVGQHVHRVALRMAGKILRPGQVTAVVNHLKGHDFPVWWRQAEAVTRGLARRDLPGEGEVGAMAVDRDLAGNGNGGSPSGAAAAASPGLSQAQIRKLVQALPEAQRKGARALQEAIRKAARGKSK